VPFYEERLGRISRDPEQLAGEAFGAIPPLEKSDIAAHGDQLLRRGAADRGPGITVVTSGGTTGVPTRIVHDAATTDAHAAAALRCHLWFGADPTRRHLLLWGPPPDENTYGFLGGRLKGFVLRRILLETYGLDDARARAYWERIVGAGRLELVVGYSSALCAIAAKARPGERARVRAAVVAAAEPIFDFQRPAIAAAFGAPVRERYGCNEFSGLAHECAEGGLHVFSDRVHLEIVRDDGSAAGPGEIGQVLVTDLDNLHMPLIRYRVGDLAEAGTTACRCALPFPTLARVHGRRRDLLRGPEGAVQSPHAFAAALEGTPARGIQLVADAERRAREVHVESDPFPIDAARERWRALAGGEVAVRFVSSLRRSRSGKVLPVLGVDEAI
jgi:phenylacetate-CoA ligase